MAISYDPAVLHKVAQDLYRQARTIVAIYTLIGLVFGLGGGIGASGAVTGELSLPVVLAGGGIMAAIGYLMGNNRALLLKAEAQKILLAMEIEQHARIGR